MSRRALITGAGGFVGSHVLQAIDQGRFPVDSVMPLPAGLDLRDADAVRSFVTANPADVVVHLAAQSFVPRSISDPEETYQVNVMGTLHLLEALSSAGFAGRLLYVSSGDVYGRVEEPALPVNPSTPACPLNPYASSKLAAEELCLQWGRRLGHDVVIARPFNHIGPGQSERFVVPSLAAQLLSIRAGTLPPVLEVGDIDSSRDFTDVRDVVEAYGRILESGVPGKRYIVASGVERRVRDIIETMVDMLGLQVEVKRDPARYRPSEQRRMVADASETRRDTGWSPGIEFQTTLKDILKV